MPALWDSRCELARKSAATTAAAAGATTAAATTKSTFAWAPRATTVVALTTAPIALGHQIYAGSGWVGLAHRAVLVFMTKGINTTLGAQMRIGARLEIVGLRATF